MSDQQEPTVRHPGGDPRDPVTGLPAEGAAGAEEGSWAEKRAKKPDQRGKKWEATGRPRPGAALAMAKREKVGIVEAQGAKIVFD